jgi:uncharacterized YigZ family protein
MVETENDLYYTIKVPSQHEIKVKGSRFLSESVVVASAEEAQAALARIRKQEHAATHHCYAYRVGLFDQMTFKYSDDGEPSGTAGRPIYDVICGHNLTRILIVVTRYFGGTKLGTGGLTRAYSDAAKQVLKESGTRENFMTDRYLVEIEFSVLDQVVRVLPCYEARRLKSDYSDVVKLELEVRKSNAEGLINEIISLTGGRARIEKNRSA